MADRKVSTISPRPYWSRLYSRLLLGSLSRIT